MYRSLQHHNLRTILGLILVIALTLNLGYQYTNESSADPLAIDLCDHADSEKESEKTEKGETDEFVDIENKDLTADWNYTMGTAALAYNHYHPDHQETHRSRLRDAPHEVGAPL